MLFHIIVAIVVFVGGVIFYHSHIKNHSPKNHNHLESVKEIELSASFTQESSKEKLFLMERQGLWPLIVFAQLYGKMQIRVETDNHEYKALIECKFTNPNGKETLTYISHTLQGKTIKQIEEMKEDLVIVRLESGSLCLCEKWSDVSLN